MVLLLVSQSHVPTCSHIVKWSLMLVPTQQVCVKSLLGGVDFSELTCNHVSIL